MLYIALTAVIVILILIKWRSGRGPPPIEGTASPPLQPGIFNLLFGHAAEAFGPPSACEKFVVWARLYKRPIRFRLGISWQ